MKQFFSSKYHRYLWILLLISFVIKISIAGLLELGNDEVYYWTYALQPDWNHFDHPPMVGWLIRLTTLNLNWVSEISLRIGSVLGSLIATWFIFKIGSIIHSERVGWFAALLFQASIYTSIIAGLFILPDSPQMPFWTAALYMMAILLKTDAKASSNWIWILLGLFIGLATLCKVHALYLWVGFGITILMNKPKWLLQWQLYLAILITLICLIPIIYWNVQYDFITYKFHSERVTHTQLQWDMLGREILGEFAYQNPIVFVLIAISIIALIKKKINFRENSLILWLLCMSVPMILFFWVIALFNPTLPHWTGPAFIPLYLLTAIYFDQKKEQIVFKIFLSACSFVFILLFLATAIVRLSPINFGSHDKENYGEYCPTLDLTGWSDFSDKYASIVAMDLKENKMKSNSFLLAPKWFPGGHLEFYVARKTKQTLISIGALTDIHKFAWLNKERKKMQLGDDAYAIVPSNLPLDPFKQYGKYFETIEAPIQINQVRNGGIVRYFYVYRLKHCINLPDEWIQ